MQAPAQLKKNWDDGGLFCGRWPGPLSAAAGSSMATHLERTCCLLVLRSFVCSALRAGNTRAVGLVVELNRLY